MCQSHTDLQVWILMNELYRESVTTMKSMIGRSRVCTSSDVSPPVMVIVQTVADVTILDTFRSSAKSRILRKSEFCIRVVNCTCINVGIHLKSKIHHTGTWLEASRPPRCLSYRPTVFLRHLCVIKLSYRQESFGVSLKNVINSGKFIV